MNYKQLAEKITRMSDYQKTQTVYFGTPIPDDAGMQYDSLTLTEDMFGLYTLVSE